MTTLSPPFIDLSISLSLVCFCVGASVLPCLWPLLLRFSCLFRFCLFSALSLLSLLLSLCLTLPRVLCLVFLAADSSGFPAPPSLPLSFLLLPFPGEAISIFVIQRVFQCGTSGRRLVRGITPLVPHYPSNPALSLAADWSRDCCVAILIHGTPY